VDAAAKQHLKNFVKVLVTLALVLGVIVGYRYSMYRQFYEYRYQDKDMDGVADYMDIDMDGDGINNDEDDDANGNETPNLDEILNAMNELAQANYSGLPFGEFMKGFMKTMRFFDNVDAVLIPYEKAGIYLGLEPGVSGPGSINSAMDLYNFIESHGRFYKIGRRSDFPAIGDIAFFGPDFCALVAQVDQDTFTVVMLVCERDTGMSLATLEKIQNNGHTLTEYGALSPQ